MNWGHKIIIAFILFAVLVTGMVVVSMNQEVDLVAKDYYRQEINYQQQIDRMTNFKALKTKPTIQVDRQSHQLIVEFPLSVSQELRSGSIQLFRPSTTKVDRNYQVVLNSQGRQAIDISNLISGRWKVQLAWESKNKKEYYNEIAINL